MITVTEQIIHKIRECVLDGQYEPGHHMHEATLATELQVSRTPIRDALRVLASEDLLVYQPNCGYVVRQVELQDVLDAYDLRGVVEGYACRVLAERGARPGLQEQFTAMLEQGDRIFQSPRWGREEQAAWRSLNTDFHFAISDAAKNKHVGMVMRQIRVFPRMFDSRFDPKSTFFQKVHTREHRLRSHHDHAHIVQAIMRREGTRAEALMREHVYTNRELLRAGIEGKPVVTEVAEVRPARVARASGRASA